MLPAPLPAGVWKLSCTWISPHLVVTRRCATVGSRVAVGRNWLNFGPGVGHYSFRVGRYWVGCRWCLGKGDAKFSGICVDVQNSPPMVLAIYGEIQNSRELRARIRIGAQR